MQHIGLQICGATDLDLIESDSEHCYKTCSVKLTP